MTEQKRSTKTTHERKVTVIQDIIFTKKQNIQWGDVERYLKQYVGAYFIIIETGESIHIASDFPDEYTGSKDTKKLKGGRAKAKANAVQGLPEIIASATNRRYKENLADKHRDNAKYGWYRYDTVFALPVYSPDGNFDRYNIFKAELLVRHDKNNKKYLYDMINIKKQK